MKTKNRFFDTLLYLGVKDERVKAAIDKAGYQTLVLIIGLFVLDINVRIVFFFKPASIAFLDVILILAISATFLMIQSYRYGATFMETAHQRRVVKTALLLTSLFFVAIGYGLVLFQTGPLVAALQPLPVLLWTFPLIFGALVYGITWALVTLYEKATQAKLAQTLKDDPEN